MKNLTRISNVPIFTVAIEVLRVNSDKCNVLPRARLGQVKSGLRSLKCEPSQIEAEVYAFTQPRQLEGRQMITTRLTSNGHARLPVHPSLSLLSVMIKLWARHRKNISWSLPQPRVRHSHFSKLDIISLLDRMRNTTRANSISSFTVIHFPFLTFVIYGPLRPLDDGEQLWQQPRGDNTPSRIQSYTNKISFQLCFSCA